MGELIGFAKKVGLNTAKAIEILGTTPVCSPAAKLAAGTMLAGNFTPMFPIELVEKDFGYVVEEAGRAGAKVPVSLAARNVFGDAISNGFSADNITGVVKLFS
jgi:3-hydroxyisobutyrate dehydrogenase